MLEFVVDHIVDYRTYVVTPVGYRKALPFCPTQLSEHMVGDRYRVRRDGCHDFLLIVTKEGAGYMSQRGQTVQLTAGTAVVIDCEPYQTYGTVEGGTWHFRYFHFNALSMEGFRNSLLSKLTVVNIPDFDRVWDLMGEMYALCDSGLPAAYARLSHAVSDILTDMVCAEADGSGEQGGARSDMLELAAFIRENCAADLHIDDFCTLTNLSRHHLIRLFERHIGITPYRYMHLCRINRALILLQDDRLSVAQIADAVGYVNAAVFIRHFKAFHNITPAAYRSEMYLP